MDIAAEAPRLEIYFSTGVVRVRGEAVRLSTTESGLLFSIARRRGPSTREELIDLVWGEAPPLQVHNAFNVALHRLRRRLGGNDAILYSDLGYSLCDGAVVDLFSLETLKRSAVRAGAFGESELAALQRVYEAWRGSFSRNAERHQWLEAASYRARSLAAELGIAFGRNALQRGECATALEIAEDLIEADPCDEQATELALHVLLQRGDRGSALRVYRRYALELQRELGVQPSRHVEALFAEQIAV